jgi:hypothetical protein
MTKQVQIRRGTTAQHVVFTGALAEVTYDTDKKTLITHDGSTVGGVELARKDFANVRKAEFPETLQVGFNTDPEYITGLTGNLNVAGVTTFAGIVTSGMSSTSSMSSWDVKIGYGNTSFIVNGDQLITGISTVATTRGTTATFNNLNVTGYGTTIFTLNTYVTQASGIGNTIVAIASSEGIVSGDIVSIGTFFSNVEITGFGQSTVPTAFNSNFLQTTLSSTVSVGSTIISVASTTGVSIGNSFSISGVGTNIPIIGFTTVALARIDNDITSTNVTAIASIGATIVAVGDTNGVSIGSSLSTVDEESIRDGTIVNARIVGLTTTTRPAYNSNFISTITTGSIGVGVTIIPFTPTTGVSIGNSISIGDFGGNYLTNVPIVGVNTNSVLVPVGSASTTLITSGASVSISTIRTDSLAVVLESPIGAGLTIGRVVLFSNPTFPVTPAFVIGVGNTFAVGLSSGTTVAVSTVTNNSPAITVGYSSVSEYEIPINENVIIRRIQNDGSRINIENGSFKNLEVVGIATINGLTFPTIDGLDGQVFVTDGQGNIGFATGGGGSGSQVLVKVSQATGDDANDGRTKPVQSIKRAAQIASFLGYFFNTGATILVESGDYIEDNPIILYDNVNIIADSLRNVVVRPLNGGIDFFKVRNGNYITGLTFTDFTDINTKIPQHTFNYAISFDEPFNTSLNRVGYACTDTVNIIGATYDVHTGITTITSSNPHELYPTNTVRLSGLGWTCGYDETGIASIRYNNVVGISTLTLRSAPNRTENGDPYVIGEKLFLYNFPFACTSEHAGVTTTIFPYDGLDTQGYGAIYPIIGINTAAKTITIQGGISTIPHTYVGWQKLGISTFVYNNTTGISTATTREAHGYQVNDKITLRDLPFSCISGAGTTTIFPDGTITTTNVDGYTFTITGVTTNNFTFNAGISTIAHTYDGFGTVGVSTFIYTNSTGVATCVVASDHGLTVGDYVTLTGLAFTCPGGSGITTSVFPDGTSPYGYTFRVSATDNATTFTINAGISTITHSYVSGGTAQKVPVVEKVPTIQKIQFYPDQHQSGIRDFGVISAASTTTFSIRGEKISTIPHYYVAGIGGTAVLSKPQIFKSPYIQNCTILSSLGGNGILVDGDKVISPNVPGVQLLAENPPSGDIPEFGKSMVAATFTMISFDGIGWRTINDGYAQVVSCFQIFCRYGSLSQSGGYLSITNSATNFGAIALRATGFSPNAFSFDKGRVAATGTSGGLQTLKVIGVGRTEQDLYVLRFLDNDGVDRTSLFKPIVVETTVNPSVGVNTNTDTLTIAGHPFIDGDSIVYLGNETAEPQIVIEGLVNGSTYYVQYIDSNNFKLYEDDSFRRPTDLRSAPVGINTFQKNNQEFIVEEIINSHGQYQRLTLAGAGSTAKFNSGQEITQSVSGGTATGFALTYHSSSRSLIVSVEEVGGSRYFFSTTGGNIVDSSPSPIAVGVTQIAGITTYKTVEFKVDSTAAGNVIQGIGNLPGTYRCNLHRPSIVNSSSHTWEFSGSGTDYNALPQNGGKANVESEQVSELGGRVYASGTNELGDFKIGSQITAYNRTGNIVFNNKVSIGELDSIRLSLSGGVAVEEFSTDTNLGEGELGGPLNKRVSTQLAVRSFMSNRLGTFIDKTVSQNAVPNAVVQLNSSGQINGDLIPPKIVNYTRSNVSTGRTVLVNEIPAIDIRNGDTIVEPELSYVLIQDVVSQYLILDNDTTDYAFSNGNTVVSALAASAIGVVTTPPVGVGIGTTISPYVGYGATGLVKGVLLGAPIQNGGSGYTTPGIYTCFLQSSTGIGTSALAEVTVGGSGTVTNVNIKTGGRYYASGNVLTAIDSNLGGRSGGGAFTVQVNDIETRLYLTLTNNQKFAGSISLPDYIADGNAVAISTTLNLDLSYEIDPTTIETGGDVDFPNDRIVVGIGHTFQNGDAVKYVTNGGTNITGVIENTTYYAKRVGVSSVELHSTYALVSRQDLSGSGIGTHALIRCGISTIKDTITFVNHGYSTGDPVRITGNTPVGVDTGAFYYIGSIVQNGFTLHLTQTDATSSASGVTFNAVGIAETGSGTITFTKQNVRYQSTVNTSSTDPANWSLLASADIDAANIISGTVSPSRLGSGSANSDTFLSGNSSYRKVVTSVGIGSTQPFGITASSSDYGVGFATHYGAVQITANRVASTLDLYSTTGVSKFKTSTFSIDSDGAVSLKNSLTGDVDASTLATNNGAYYLNSANHTGTIPLSRGGTGQTGLPANGAILIGNGSAYNLTATPNFKSAFTIDTSGTSATSRTLTIKNDGQSLLNYGAYSGAWRSGFQLQSNDNNHLLFMIPPNSDYGYSFIRSANGGFIFSVGGTTTTTGSTALTIETTTNATFAGTGTFNSDLRLKKNIFTIENALEKTLKLRGVEYDRIDNEDHQIGLIAQEVEEVIPQVVYTPEGDSEGMKSVAYQNIVGLLIESIKEQQKQIEDLKTSIDELKSQLNK